MFQALILMGSPRVLLTEKWSDEGMFLDWGRVVNDLSIVSEF